MVCSSRTAYHARPRPWYAVCRVETEAHDGGDRCGPDATGGQQSEGGVGAVSNRDDGTVGMPAPDRLEPPPVRGAHPLAAVQSRHAPAVRCPRRLTAPETPTVEELAEICPEPFPGTLAAKTCVATVFTRRSLHIRHCRISMCRISMEDAVHR